MQFLPLYHLDTKSAFVGPQVLYVLMNDSEVTKANFRYL